MSRIDGFIAYLESHVGDMYVWGAQGQRVDTMDDPETWIRRRETSTRNCDRAVKFFRGATKRPLYAFDCSGLIVHYISDTMHWIKGDTSAHGLYGMCRDNRGYFGMAEMRPGDLLFIEGAKNGQKAMVHVGVYVGDGYTIEAKGRDDGVCKRLLSQGDWTHWGRLPLLQADDPEETEEKVAKKIELTSPMMRGDDIKALQTALNALGYDAGDADGIAGKNTIAAIQRFAGDYANAGEKELPEVLQATVSVDGKIYVGTLKK